MLYCLEKYLLFSIGVFSPSKYYLNETKNNVCIKSSRNSASEAEFFALFAKRNLLLRKLDSY